MANRVLFKEILQNTLLNVQNSILALRPLHWHVASIKQEASRAGELYVCSNRVWQCLGHGHLKSAQKKIPWLGVPSVAPWPFIWECRVVSFPPLKCTDRRKAADWLGFEEAWTRFLAWCHGSQQSGRPATFYQVGGAREGAEPNERLHWALFCALFCTVSPCHPGWPSFCRDPK